MVNGSSLNVVALRLLEVKIDTSGKFCRPCGWAVTSRADIEKAVVGPECFVC